MNGADETLRRKTAQLQKFFDDVEELLERSADIEEPAVTRFRHRVGASLKRLSTGARDGTQAAVRGTRKAAHATNGYVRSKPWVAIGATGAAGLLAGALLRGRRN